MARLAASFISVGAGKSGKPCARLTAPLRSARRVISRMTDSVKSLVLWETSVGIATPVYARTRPRAKRPIVEEFWSATMRLSARVCYRNRFLGDGFLEQPCALLETPFVDDLDVETPVATDFESGQLPLLEEAIDGRPMNAEIVG